VVAAVLAGGAAALTPAVRVMGAVALAQPLPIPGSVALPPYGSAVFSPPRVGPLPSPQLVVTSVADTPVTVTYTADALGTLAATAEPGRIVLVATPDDLNAQCDASGQQPPHVSCTAVQPNGPPLAHRVNIGTLPLDTPPAVAVRAGWNLLAGPPETTLAGAVSPLYTLDPGATAYRTVPAGVPLTAGVGYWAYFSQTMTTPLALGPSAGTRPLALARGQYTLVGNPFPTAALISGTLDRAVVYDPATGYQDAPRTSDVRQAVILKPGQGVWLYATAAPVVISPEMLVQ